MGKQDDISEGGSEILWIFGPVGITLRGGDMADEKDNNQEADGGSTS